MRRIALIATVALLGLTSCGDDSSSGGTTPGTEADVAVTEAVGNTVVDETVVDDTVVDDTVVDDTVVDELFPVDTADPNAPGFGSEFCDVTDELNALNFDPFAATRDEVEEFFTVSFPDMFGRLVTSAPPELENDMVTLRKAYGLLTTELENNGWDMKAAFGNSTVQETMTGEELSAAGDNLDAYCGL